jgi:hypothetical protein
MTIISHAMTPSGEAHPPGTTCPGMTRRPRHSVPHAVIRYRTFWEWSYEAVHIDPRVGIPGERVVFDAVEAGSIHEQTLKRGNRQSEMDR